MRKIFTLMAAASIACSVNAQEVWNCYEEGADGLVLKSVYTPNENAEAASVVDMSTASVKAEQVSGPVAGYKDGPLVDGRLEMNVNNGWDQKKFTVYKPDGTSMPLNFVVGKGNPVNLDLVKFEEIVTDGEGTGRYRADWTDSYYNPDGSAGLPGNGTYLKFTPSANGYLTACCWINKGKREMFVVKNSDMKAIPYGTDVTVSGYVWSENYDVPEGDPLYGQARFQEDIKTRAEILEAQNAADPSAAVTITEADKWIIGLGDGNRQTLAYIKVKVVANETYWIFQKSSQVGLSSYEFVAEGGGDTPVEPATGLNYLPLVVNTTVEGDETKAVNFEAGAVIYDNEALKATLIYPGLTGINAEYVYNLDEAGTEKTPVFTNWFEIRSKKPSGDITAPEQDGATRTPILLEVKKDLTKLYSFVRTGNTKHVVLYDASCAEVANSAEILVTDPTSESNAFFTTIWSDVKAGTYLLTESGGTGRFSGLAYETGSSAIETIVVDENAPVEYYNLQGVRIANPEHGLYIKRQGNKVTKVIL